MAQYPIPLISIEEVSALCRQLALGVSDPRLANLMFVPKDSRDGQWVNLQYSINSSVGKETIWLDWVLPGGCTIEDKESAAAFCTGLGYDFHDFKALGHAFGTSEVASGDFLRVEGHELAEMGVRILSDFYQFGPGDKFKLLVEGFEWPET